MLSQAVEDYIKTIYKVEEEFGSASTTEIAKRMNEANNKGMRPLFGKASLAQMRSLAGFVLDFADQVDLLARRRTDRVRLIATDALKELAHGEK